MHSSSTGVSFDNGDVVLHGGRPVGEMIRSGCQCNGRRRAVGSTELEFKTCEHEDRPWVGKKIRKLREMSQKDEYSEEIDERDSERGHRDAGSNPG